LLNIVVDIDNIHKIRYTQLPGLVPEDDPDNRRMRLVRLREGENQ
jgi:hypothetical protein